MAYTEKVVINAKYAQPKVKEFIKKLPKLFKNSGTTIYKARNTIKTFELDDIHFNVKSFKKPHLINQFAYAILRDSKAKRSYEYAKKLTSLEINTPSPVAYLEFRNLCFFKRSFYVSEHIEVDGEMRVIQQGEVSMHLPLIKQFAEFTASLHKAKVLHIDYSPGNILFKKEADVYSFFLVDLNRMAFGKYIGIEEAAHNFRRLWGSDEMIACFAREYAIARGFDQNIFTTKVFYYHAEFWKKVKKKHPGDKAYKGEKETKIGYDAKRATQNFTGLGNYSRFVINNMSSIYTDATYYLFSPKPIPEKIKNELNSSTNIIQLLKNGFNPLWRSFGIVKDLKQRQLDLYHGLSNEIPIGIQRSGIKSIVTIHDLIFKTHPEFYPPIDRWIYDVKAKYACRNADRIVAVSECTKKDIVRLYGIEPDKIDVVYQGCFDIFAEEATDSLKEEVSKKYKLPDKYILSVGSIEDRKNILLIVKALKQVPNIHFVAIGKKQKYARLVEKYAEENGLRDRVHLMSGIPLKHLPVILQQAQLFIYPSLYEGFGIPIIEALSSGIPVIAATGSCLEEAGGPHSVYVNPHDENELASEINRLLADEDARNKMIREGREYTKRFSNITCTKMLNEVYKKVIGE